MDFFSTLLGLHLFFKPRITKLIFGFMLILFALAALFVAEKITVAPLFLLAVGILLLKHPRK